MQEPQNLRFLSRCRDQFSEWGLGIGGRAEGANMFKRWMDKNCYCPVGVDPRGLRLVQLEEGHRLEIFFQAEDKLPIFNLVTQE